MSRHLSTLLCVCLALLACSGEPPPPLGDTAWQLVEIRSQNAPVVRPDDGAKYTLEFAADGKVAVRADCNRGHGPWTADEAGQLSFGALATTRAMCPPGSLDATFLRGLSVVRSYAVRDGRLLLSLSDGRVLDLAAVAAPRAEVTPESRPATLEAELARLTDLASQEPGVGESLRESQLDFEAAREACDANAAPGTCRRDLTLFRIALIRSQSAAARSQDEGGVSRGPFSFRCENLAGHVVATFVEADPPLALITNLASAIAMRRVSAASGEKYEGASPDQFFWEHQGEATYRAGSDQPEVTCAPLPDAR